MALKIGQAIKWKPTNGRPARQGVIVWIVPANTPARWKQKNPGAYPIVIDDAANEIINDLREEYDCLSVVGKGLPRSRDSHIVLSKNSTGRDCLFWPDAELVPLP